MASMNRDELFKKLKKIRLIILDVDGVLTNDCIYVGEGGTEFKRFDVADGLAIRLITLLDVETGIISARYSPATDARMSELKIPYVYQKYDKVGCFHEMIEKAGVEPEETCFMGNDILDMEVMGLAGVAACPADAVPEVIAISDVRTEKNGGEGAVRDLYELVAEAKGTKLVDLVSVWKNQSKEPKK